jgi:hypothetical protein
MHFSLVSDRTDKHFYWERDCSCAEIDLKQIVDYQRGRIERWQREAVLPQRTIEFLAADLTNDVDQERVNQALGHWCQNHNALCLKHPGLLIPDVATEKLVIRQDEAYTTHLRVSDW